MFFFSAACRLRRLLLLEVELQAFLCPQVNNEVEFLRNAGPAEWESSAGEGGGEAFSCWRWHKPVNTVWDNNRGVYVRERGGVDPTLCLNELRQTLLQINRMMSMSKGEAASLAYQGMRSSSRLPLRSQGLACAAVFGCFRGQSVLLPSDFCGWERPRSFRDWSCLRQNACRRSGKRSPRRPSELAHPGLGQQRSPHNPRPRAGVLGTREK